MVFDRSNRHIIPRWFLLLQYLFAFDDHSSQLHELLIGKVHLQVSLLRLKVKIYLPQRLERQPENSDNNEHLLDLGDTFDDKVSLQVSQTIHVSLLVKRGLVD